MEVTYWLGRKFWGRGLATHALNRMLQLVADRPIFARAATDNIGSIRVLQKCGFKIVGKNKGFANGRGEETEEFILRLDLDQAMNELASPRMKPTSETFDGRSAILGMGTTLLSLSPPR